MRSSTFAAPTKGKCTLAAISIMLLLAGCDSAGGNAGGQGGGNGGGGVDGTRLYSDFDPSTVSERACDALTLSASNGVPLDTITISGLPPEVGQVAVYLETVTDQVGVLYPTGTVEGGQADFFVPVSPDANPDGGDVMLTVTNTVEACPAVPFTIDPLPAPAADYATYMGDLADRTQEFLDLVAQMFGTDYATLSSADTVPAEGLVPIFAAIKAFDAALKSTPNLDTDEDRELVVRLLTQADALGVLQDAIDGLDQSLIDIGSFNVATAPLPQALAGQTGGKVALPAGVQTSADKGEAAGCTMIAPPDADIPSTERLSAIMSSPAVEAIAGGLDAFSSAMSAISSLLGVAGLSGPTDALGALATATGTAANFAVAAAPSAFTSLSFDAESPIWEDQSTPEPAWGNAQAQVTSTPFNVSAAVADNLLALAGMSPVGGWTITVITYSYEDEVAAALEDVVGPEGSLCVTVPAQTWGPFDVSSSDWSTSAIDGDTVTRRTHETYVPAMLGSSTIRVEVQGDKFGGATIPAESSVLVEAKTVSISPISPKVDDPGDPLTLTVSVNAHFPETVDFTPPPGVMSVDVTHEYLGGGIHTYAFDTPRFEEQFPAPFKVESKSAKVPPDTFERADTVNILLNAGTLEITGQRGCIAPGETVDLVAVLTGFDDPDAKTVTWTESAGSTSPALDTRQATFTAPGTLGVVTVRAETPVPGSEEPAADEVQMEVSDNCLQQFMAAFVQSSADGDPDCDGPLGSREDLGQDAVVIALFPPEYTVPQDYFLGERTPMPDAPFFSGAPVNLMTESSFTESISAGEDGCQTRQPSSRAEVVLESAGSSGHWEIHFDNSGTCLDEMFINNCNVGQSLTFVDHYLYLTIEEAGTYELTMDLSCTLYPHFGGIYLTMSRYIDGEGFPQPPNASGEPTLPRNTLLDFACDSGTITRTVTLDLVGPLGNSGTDLLTIGYQGAPAGYFNSLTPEQILENEEALTPSVTSTQFIFDMVVDVRLERMD